MFLELIYLFGALVILYIAMDFCFRFAIWLLKKRRKSSHNQPT